MFCEYFVCHSFRFRTRGMASSAWRYNQLVTFNLKFDFGFGVPLQHFQKRLGHNDSLRIPDLGQLPNDCGHGSSSSLYGVQSHSIEIAAVIIMYNAVITCWLTYLHIVSKPSATEAFNSSTGFATSISNSAHILPTPLRQTSPSPQPTLLAASRTGKANPRHRQPHGVIITRMLNTPRRAHGSYAHRDWSRPF